MVRVYLKPGDRVEGMCALSYGADGEFHQPEILDSGSLRHFREDEGHEDGGEWFRLRYDFGESRASNPKWGVPYFEDDDPGY